MLTCHSLGVAFFRFPMFLTESPSANPGDEIMELISNPGIFSTWNCQECKKHPYIVQVVLNNSYWSYSTLVNYSIEPPSSVLETRRDVPEKLLQVSPTEEIAMKVEKSLFLSKKTYPGSMGKCHIYIITHIIYKYIILIFARKETVS